MSTVLDGKGGNLCRGVRARQPADMGVAQLTFRILCKRHSPPPRTGASFSTTASTSAASSAPSSAISPIQGRPQGGSTITQQVVKNLLVGEDVTYERKIREMIVASRLESTLSKNEILELYLNTAYFGRGSWGVDMAARSYFGVTAKNLTLAQGAMLAGLLKGPNYFNPDRHPDRAKERLGYVLGRMQEDGVISAAQKDQARPPICPSSSPSIGRTAIQASTLSITSGARQSRMASRA